MFDVVKNALFEAHHTRWVWKLLNGFIDQSGVARNSTVHEHLIDAWPQLDAPKRCAAMRNLKFIGTSRAAIAEKAPEGLCMAAAAPPGASPRRLRVGSVPVALR